MPGSAGAAQGGRYSPELRSGSTPELGSSNKAVR